MLIVYSLYKTQNICSLLISNLPQRQGEYLMVRLRTSDGVDFLDLEKRYNIDSTPYEEAFRSLMGNGLVAHQGARWYLTEKGFLVSNSIINTIVEAGQPDGIE